MVQPDDALAVLGKKFRADRIKPRPLVIVARSVKIRKRRLNRFDRLQHRLQPIADCFESTRRRCWGFTGTIDLFVRLRQNIGAAVEPAKRRQNDFGGIKLRALSIGSCISLSHNNSFDPRTLLDLETAFDEAWFTLKSIGNTTVKPNELARCVLRLARKVNVILHD
jgi:hypothetical protein